MELSVLSHFVSPQTLFYIRIPSLLFTLAMTGWTLSVEPNVYFAFFTNWSWIGLCLYYIVCSCHRNTRFQPNSPLIFEQTVVTLSYTYLETGSLRGSTEKQDKLLSVRICLSLSHNLSSLTATKKQTAYRGFFAITQTCTWLVVIIYWGLLSGNIGSKTDNNQKSIVILEHSTDLILVLMEMFLCRTPLYWLDFVYPIVIALLYTLWTWIFVYANVWSWPYNFFKDVLNPLYKPWWVTVLALVAGSLAVAIIFSIVFGTYKLREAMGIRSRKLAADKRVSHQINQDNISMTRRSSEADLAPVMIEIPPKSPMP